MTHDAGKTGSLAHPSLLEAILQTSSEAIMASDVDGRILFWNPGATRIIGFDAAAILNSARFMTLLQGRAS
jgi:PAS domain S-box-containing protein